MESDESGDEEVKDVEGGIRSLLKDTWLRYSTNHRVCTNQLRFRLEQDICFIS